MENGGEGRYLAPLIAHWRGVKVDAIKPGHVREAARKLYPSTKPATQRRQAITPAMAVINHAHDKGWCGMIRVKIRMGKKPTRQAVKRDYIDAIRARCFARKPAAPHLAALMLFLHQSGARLGEALAMTPEDIDLDSATAHARDTKNGEAHTYALTQELAAELRGLKPREGRVFGYVNRRGVYLALKNVCEEAGVPYLGTHQPGRHSFATTLEGLGWGAAAIASAGNWKSVGLVSSTYIHPENASRRAAEALDIGTKNAHNAIKDDASK